MSRLVTAKRGILGAVTLVATVAGTLAIHDVGAEEGLRLQTYKDIVGVPTYCYGETRGAKMGATFTKAQCDELLLKRLDEFATAVERCITRPMSDRTLVAFVGMAYNVGEAGFCKSSTARLYNAGQRAQACDAMLMWNKAGGRAVKGLTARRQRERTACLKGLAE